MLYKSCLNKLMSITYNSVLFNLPDQIDLLYKSYLNKLTEGCERVAGDGCHVATGGDHGSREEGGQLHLARSVFGNLLVFVN
jgi:hypothetical protein